MVSAVTRTCTVPPGAPETVMDAGSGVVRWFILVLMGLRRRRISVVTVPGYTKNVPSTAWQVRNSQGKSGFANQVTDTYRRQVALNRWTQTDRRIGIYSAVAVVAIILAYITTGLIGVVAWPANSSTLRQVDPYLAILEYLIILAAVVLVVMMSAVYTYAPPDRKTYALVALAFIVVFATLTCSLHFAALTVGRQLDPSLAPQLLRQLSFETVWPNVGLAVELLAWDFFFGLSMVFASRVFSGSRLQNYVRASM